MEKMRTIKFRGKRLDNGGWAYGSLAAYPKHHVIVTVEDGGRRYSEHIIDPATAGQFTGLKDRDGRDIYDGDILNNHDEPNPLTVKWDAACCRFALFNQDGDFECDFSQLEVRLGVAVDAEVTDNIHDNPELMKGSGI